MFFEDNVECYFRVEAAIVSNTDDRLSVCCGGGKHFACTFYTVAVEVIVKRYAHVLVQHLRQLVVAEPYFFGEVFQRNLALHEDPIFFHQLCKAVFIMAI